jgi:putative glutamine amidotransferase
MSARSSERPLVAICAVRERARWSFWDQAANLVAHSYVGALQRSGAVPLIVPIDEHAPAPVVDLVDGLLLIGGADVDPATYAAAREPETEATYPERDAFELAMLHAALERGLPVLAICRGMQILNVALGGTLNQNLVAEDGSNPHRRLIGTFVGTEHDIELDAGTLVAEATGEEVHEARCHHHQALDRLGDGLVVTGRARDGVPEAIELVDGQGWALGVQWHPEAGDKRQLFQAFAGAAREWSKGPHLTPTGRREI